MSKGLDALNNLFFCAKNSRGCARIEQIIQYNDIIEEELKDKEKKDKFVKLVMQWLDNGHDITKILKDIENSESYGDFINLYPFAPKEEYDLLKEVLKDE